jgi:membrane protease YdiL (CAAX protease family)
VIPYSLALNPVKIDISPLLIVLSTVVNNLIIYAAAIFLGLLFSKKIGMGLPILEGVLKKENKTKEFKALLIPSICIGILAGVLMLIASIPFNKLIPELASESVAPAVWKGFLASFYGGIAEEVLLRLFVVSLLVWITFKIKKNDNGSPTNFGIWLSIILAAILFGIGHLPATAAIVPLTGIVVFRAILLNGIGGLILGWLYWKKGLESAIITHFTIDIVLHVIFPFILSFI